MDAANADASTEKRGLRWRDALGGLEAGVAGALLMIGWLMLCSVSIGHSVWAAPNLFATAWYGPEAYQNRFLRSSWPGVALMVAIYGVGGMVWGVLCGLFLRDGRRPRYFALSSAVTGLIVYYVFFDGIWTYVNPVIVLYAPERPMQIAHVLWGMALARAPLYSGRIAAATADPRVAPAAQEAEEVRSGEVIL